MTLRRTEDRRTLGLLAAWFAIVALAYAGAAPAWALAPLSAWFAFTAAVIAHNTIHVAVFVERPANALFQVLVTLAYGHPVSTFRPGHNLSHHADLEGPGDVMRTSRARFRPHLLNGLFFFWSIAGDIAALEYRHVREAWRRRSPWFAQFVLEGAALLAFGLVLFVVDPWTFVCVVAVPWHLAAWGIVTINLVQHDGCDPTDPYRDSRNFTGRWVNWWLLNNGYHGMHHRRPTLHWADLPAAHAAELAGRVPAALEQPALLPWLVRTYLVPGGRRTWDGRPVEIGPEGTPEPS